MPKAVAVGISQGHYRIGSRREPFAYDNELPPQVVELSSFRIGQKPVSNAEYLAFMESGGYRRNTFWTTQGRAWKTSDPQASHPDHWRRDAQGSWYAIGINGAFDLDGEEPVMGINQHEAKAYANWISSLGGDHSGAVLPHEYQWEVASRNGRLELPGRAWEWCSNPFHPYPEFKPFPSEPGSRIYFHDRHRSLRGASIHTQQILRRSSYRNHALPEQRFLFAGTRLVFPPVG